MEKRKIFLIGMMGSGKTTVGKKLSNKLHIPFLDLDQEIEKKEGKTIAQIFALHGEKYFREIEHEVLIALIEKESFVLSTGGGTPCFYDNMEHMKQSGTSIYLQLHPKSLTDRLIHAKNQRPLIQNKSEDEILEFITNLLEKREAYYMKSDLIAKGENLSASKLLVLIEKK